MQLQRCSLRSNIKKYGYLKTKLYQLPHKKEDATRRKRLSKNLGTSCQGGQSVERRILEVEVQCSKPALGPWWWCWISPNQPYTRGAAPAATTPFNEWLLQISLNGINTVSKKKNTVCSISLLKWKPK